GTAQGGTAQGGTAQEDARRAAAPQAVTPRQGAAQETTAPGGTAQGPTPQTGTPQSGTAQEDARQAATPQADTPRQGAAQEAPTPRGTSQDGTAREATPQGGTESGGAGSSDAAAAEAGSESPASRVGRWLSWLRRRPAPAAAANADTESGPAASAAAGAEPRPGAPSGASAGSSPAPVAPARPAPARPVPAPRAPATPPVASPAPVLPARAVAPRPVVRPLPASDDVTGAPCPACGTPNPPDRRFCRRCATPLTPTTIAAPLPWWRTVWPFRRRTRAGSGRLVRFLVVLGVVLALCAAAFLLLPAGRHLMEDTRDKLGKAKAVTPTRVQATAELPGHPVAHSTDGLSNRYWGAPAPGTSATYTFGKPFRLVDVIVTNGASPAPEEYAKQGRALRIDMEVTDRDGATVHKKLVLSDKPGPQTFPLGISDVTTIRLTLEEPAGSAPDRHLALAEVEFFQRG
ncbi:NADase-type glycan-binding domain-containing protein, partial [Streptomyces virginiae]